MPSEWLKEMQQGRETEGPGHVPAAAAEQRSSRRDRQPTRLPADDSAQDGEEDGGGLKVFQPSLTSFVVSSLASLVVVGAAIYYANRMHRPAKSARGIQSGLLIASELDRVYNYLSTPDFRTEWHFNAVEVSGPAIDHSAVPGEMFAEELRVGGRDVNLDWNVLERQFPTSPQTTFAEFVVEGTAAVDSPSGPARKEHWRQVFRMRAGPQQFGGGDQVHVEFELIVDGKDAKDTPDKWRKSLLRSIKRSLENAKDRIEEDTRVHPSPHKIKAENKRRRQEKQAGEAQEASAATAGQGAADKKKKKKKKTQKDSAQSQGKKGFW